MRVLNISEAKAQLSAVIEAVVKTGESCVIGKAGRPVVKIVRYEPGRSARRLGLFKGQIALSEDWDVWPDDIARALGIEKA